MNDEAAEWKTDPSGRHQHRYWDGSQWTDHVSDAGVTSVDALSGGPAAWKIDPSGRHQHRYWDGTAWTEQVSDDGATSTDADGLPAPLTPTPAGASAAPPKSKGGGKKVMWWAIAAVVVVVIIAAAAGGGSDKKDDKSSSASVSSKGSAKEDSGSSKSDDESDSCGTKATDDCTPHLSSSEQVRVDALLWSISSARSAATIGDQTYGTGAKANGIFVIVKLQVHSDKNESATLSDDVIKLEVNGNSYDPDNDGTVAEIGSGQQPFLFDTIGPDSDRTGTVVFDVPPSVLSENPELRFNELGFGQTHGYLELPSV